MATYFGSSRGRRRKIVDGLNLVPFIDLFSTMIIFLLATAVWDQLAAIRANVGQAGGSATVQSPQDLVRRVQASLRVSISDQHMELFDSGRSERLEIVDGSVFDLDRVQAFVEAARAKYSDKNDVVIEASDLAKYEHLVIVMDQFLAQEFYDLIVMGMPDNPGQRRR